jgi:hypothetical protein
MNQQEARAQTMVWWILWAAFQVGIVIIYRTLSGALPQPPTEPVDSSAWLAGFAPLTISVIIRWFVLPRARTAQSALPVFIIGIAMAESATFFGLYIFPAHRQELFMWSALGIFQFIPYFVSRYFKPKDEHLGA